MKNLNTGISAFILLNTLFFGSCKDKTNTQVVAPMLTNKTIFNLPADTITPHNGRFTLFSFENGKIISNSDSASTKWDIGFNGTKIILNGGSSGPGKAETTIVNGVFDEFFLAPSIGFQTDSLPPARTPLAIEARSGAGWYNYNSTSMIITPIAGKILVFKTATGKYAKLEILSYYKNKPINPVLTDKSRFYSFRYLFQPDGTTNLK